MDITELDAVMKNLQVAIFNAKQQCELAMEELNKLKAETLEDIAKLRGDDK